MPAIPPALAFLFGPGEQPWTDLPDPGPTPNVTPVDELIPLDSNFTIAAGETYFSNSDMLALFRFGNLIDITNDGLIWIQSTTNDVSALTGNNSNIFVNNGDIVALSSESAARGFVTFAWGLIKNYGTITAVSYDFGAVGYYTYSTRSWSGDPDNLNAGTIQAWSGTFSATGVGFGGGVESFINTGEILATGFTEAIALFSDGDLTLNNSGLIQAESSMSGVSYGVLVTEAFDGIQIDNSGTISGDYAILFSPFNPNKTSLINNTETGNLNGVVYLEGTTDRVINAGSISGDVYLQDLDDYIDNSVGTIGGVIDLGSGDDTAILGALAERVIGGGGNDTIDYSHSTEAVVATVAGGTTGYAAGDTFSGIENLLGSAFNDVLSGDGKANLISGGAGADTLNGESGSDTVSYLGSSAAVFVNLQQDSVFGGDAEGDDISSFENAIGSVFNDTLIGTTGGNTFQGNEGADLLDGAEGIDTVSYSDSTAGVFVDLVNGLGAGGDAQGDLITNFENIIGSGYDDTLFGESGANSLTGGDGNDTLIGAAGADTLIGGAGVDTVSYASSSLPISVNLQSGSVSGGDAQGDILVGIENIVGSSFDDTIISKVTAKSVLQGEDGNDFLLSNGDGDTLIGGAGDDTLTGGRGTNTYNGGADIDTVTYVSSRDKVFVNLAMGLGGREGYGLGDAFISVENLVGSLLADMLIGDAASNAIDGVSGADEIHGEGGADTLYGGAGDDTLNGGGGDDAIFGDAGRDLLFGGNDNDFLHGFGSHDTLGGGRGNDDLRGGFGKDLLNGSSGNDTLRGFEGDDRLFGGGGADTLLGNDGDDSLTGGGGVDRLKGDAGDDTLNGRFGDDLVTGGAGDDLFEFRQGHGNDTYDDFVAGGGTDDAIELIAFGADFDTFAEVIAAASDNGAHTTIDFGGGDSILLLNVVVADLHEDDFIFS